MAKHIAVIGVAGALFLSWIADEVKAWIPWCARHFFDLSVRLLPDSERERFSEEWRGHIESLPGTGLASAQFILAALEIRFLVMKEALLQWWTGYCAHFSLMGLLVYCWLKGKLSARMETQELVADRNSIEISNQAIAVFVILSAFVLLDHASQRQA